MAGVDLKDNPTSHPIAPLREIDGLNSHTRVRIFPDRVRYYPLGTLFHNTITEFLYENSELHTRFKFWDLLRNAHIPNVHVPPRAIKGTDQGVPYYEVERARGFNLTRGSSAVGKTISPPERGSCFFQPFDARQRINGVLAYLRIISLLNSSGYVFADHKTDSVFLNTKNGEITVVDTGMLTGKNAPVGEARWHTETGNMKISDLDSTLIGVLRGFFTRGYGTELPWVINFLPKGLAHIIDTMNTFHYASECSGAINAWLPSANARREILDANRVAFHFVSRVYSRQFQYAEQQYARRIIDSEQDALPPRI